MPAWLYIDRNDGLFPQGSHPSPGDGHGDVIMGADPYADMCAKEEILKKILRPGLKMLVVGDGKVEIQLGSDAGAVTLGVASWDDHENMGPGLEPVKEKRLINAGAHGLVADFTHWEEILNWI